MDLQAIRVRVAQVPEAFMGRDQAFHIPPARAVWRERAPRQHHFKDMQELFGDLKIRLVTGMVKGDEDLVGQPAAVARRPSDPDLAYVILFRVAQGTSCPRRNPAHLIRAVFLTILGLQHDPGRVIVGFAARS